MDKWFMRCWYGQGFWAILLTVTYCLASACLSATPEHCGEVGGVERLPNAAWWDPNEQAIDILTTFCQRKGSLGS
jgi:hypothetical protein